METKTEPLTSYFFGTTGVLQTVLSYMSSVVLKAVILIGCLRGLGGFLSPWLALDSLHLSLFPMAKEFRLTLERRSGLQRFPI